MIDIQKGFDLEMIKVTFSILQHLNLLFTECCSQYAINNRKPGEVIAACAHILCTARDAVIIAKLGVYLFQKPHKVHDGLCQECK